MKRLLWPAPAIVAVAIAVAGALHAGGRPPSGEPAVTTDPPAPLLYFADAPDRCYPIGGTTYYVYVNAPGWTDLTGVSFDLNLSAFGSPQTPLVSPVNVTGWTADTSSLPYHIEASWNPRTQVQDPILLVQYSDDPLLGGPQYAENVEFTTSGGATVAGTGGWSFAGCCLDCFPCSMGIYADAHVLAAADETTTIPFQYVWYCYTTGGGDLTVTDTEGWVSSWWPSSAGGSETCTVCVVPVGNGEVEVLVPADTEPGTTSMVTISVAGFGGTTIIVEADDGVPVEQTTWGRIKSLYR